MQTYKIHSIVSEADAQYGKKRVVFKLNEMGEKMISCFTKFPDALKEGAEIFGTIKEVEKDGKTYYNFEFGKKDVPSTGGPALDKLEKILDGITSIKLSLQKIERAVVKPAKAAPSPYDTAFDDPGPTEADF